MNKKELIEAIAKKTGLTQKDSADYLNAIIETIEEQLIQNEPIKVLGFGCLKTVERKPRIGRNPRNPEQIVNIPASKTVAFKVSSELKKKLNR